MFKPMPKSDEIRKHTQAMLEVREILWKNSLLQVRQVPRGQRLSFGEQKGTDVYVGQEVLGRSRAQFVDFSDEGLTIFWQVGGQGVVHVDGKEISFDELVSEGRAEDDLQHGYRFRLPLNGSATYRFGALDVHLRLVNRERLPKTPWHKRLEYTYNGIVLVMLMAWAVLGLYLKQLPAPEVADIIDNGIDIRRPVHMAILEALKKQKPPEKKPIARTTARFGDMGKVGKKDGPLDKAKGSPIKKRSDEDVVSEAGLLALGETLSKMERVFGGGDLAADLKETLGRLTGLEGVNQRGTQGFGSRGAGLGGDGVSLGLGDGLMTKGKHGSGDRGYGVEAGSKLNHTGKIEDIEIKDVVATAGPDKSVIARVLKKHYSQIRHCYQRELNKNSSLYGKITVDFVIAENGIVTRSGVRVSTMKNDAVEQCVARVIKRIVFPEMPGGGIVNVRYPFIFRVDGQ